MTVQAFKQTDPIEQKVTAAFMPTLQSIGDDRDAFYAGAYECFALGDVLFDSRRSPLAGVISKETFRRSFFAIHELFTRPGTFEYYLEVLRAVWGDDVEVEFEVPGPGKLTINIHHSSIEIALYNLLGRTIIDNVYTYDEIIDEDENLIAGQQITGLISRNEMKALMFELAVGGVWIKVNFIVDEEE